MEGIGNIIYDFILLFLKFYSISYSSLLLLSTVYVAVINILNNNHLSAIPYAFKSMIYFILIKLAVRYSTSIKEILTIILVQIIVIILFRFSVETSFKDDENEEQ